MVRGGVAASKKSVPTVYASGMPSERRTAISCVAMTFCLRLAGSAQDACVAPLSGPHGHDCPEPPTQRQELRLKLLKGPCSDVHVVGMVVPSLFSFVM